MTCHPGHSHTQFVFSNRPTAPFLSDLLYSLNRPLFFSRRRGCCTGPRGRCSHWQGSQPAGAMGTGGSSQPARDLAAGGRLRNHGARSRQGRNRPDGLEKQPGVGLASAVGLGAEWRSGYGAAGAQSDGARRGGEVGRGAISTGRSPPIRHDEETTCGGEEGRGAIGTGQSGEPDGGAQLEAARHCRL